MGATKTAWMTVAEFLEIPEAATGYNELHHGEVVPMAFPKWGHEQIQDRIQMLLKALLSGKGAVRMEMAFRPLPEHELWRADVGFVTALRTDSIGEDEYLMGAPDLVVEVLSPSNTVDEINDKMSMCLENGCASFWVVDPKRRRVSVTEGDLTKHYNHAARIVCSVLAEELAVRSIFEA